MFGPFMKEGTVSDLKSTPIVTIKRCKSGGVNLKISKKVTKSNDLSRGVCNGMILSLSARARDNSLLFLHQEIRDDPSKMQKSMVE